MSIWRHLTHGVRGLTHAESAQQDVDDEVRDYFDKAEEEYVARGLSPAEARRSARRDLGNMMAVSDEVRSYGWENVLGAAIADLRYGARRLRATPGVTAIAILTLAIGIGATTAIFGAVNPILVEPLPYPRPGDLVSVLEVHADTVGSASAGTFAMYHRFAERSRTLDSIAAVKPWQPTVTAVDRPERLAGQRVSAAYFHVLGVAPLIGRDFDIADDRAHGPNVTILSDALWRRHFGADPAIIGRQINLDDDLYAVVGVMPPAFDNVLAPDAVLWAPLQYDASIPAHGREWGHHLQTIARVRPGVGVEAAARELDALGGAYLSEVHPETYGANTQFTAVSLKAELTGGVRPVLLVLLGAAMVVMLIACVNVTNLQLSRGVQRRAEFALRVALGAGRSRLMRQLLTESLLLAALGGIAGFAVAALGVRALVAWVPAELPRAGSINVNLPLLAFALAATTVVGIVVGLIPAFQAMRSDPRAEVQHGARHTRARTSARRALVVTEVGLALVLLVSSGLLLRSMQALLAEPVGFDPSHLITMQVQLTGHRFDDGAAEDRYRNAVLDAVRRVPGVISAGFTEQLPLSGDRDEYGAQFGANATQPQVTYGAFRYAVTPGYLETMGIPLRSGRLLDERDRAGASLAALVSESLALERFGRQDPIGQQLRIGSAGPFTIVGVVGDVRQLSLALTDADAVYLTASQSWFSNRAMSLVARTRGEAAALAPSIRQALASVDKNQPIGRVATMQQLLAATAAERRFALLLFEAFAIAALILAAAGIYAVLAGTVAERTREIGVRTALGASRGDIIALVLRQGMLLAALGMAIGLAGAGMATRAIAAMLFSVSRLDPATYVGVVALLAAVSAIACAVPAWRASRVDPAITLRAE